MNVLFCPSPRKAAEVFKCFIGITFRVDGNRPRPLGDGAADKGYRHVFALPGPANGFLEPCGISRLHQGSLQHFTVSCRSQIDGLLLGFLRYTIAVPKIKLHRRKRQASGLGKHKTHLSGHIVRLRPFILVQLQDSFHTVRRYVLFYFGSGGAVLFPSVHLKDKLCRPALPFRHLYRHADAVHQPAESLRPAQKPQNSFLRDVSRNPGKAYKPFSIQVNILNAPSVRLRGTGYLLPAHYIEAPPLCRRVSGRSRSL